MSQTNQRLQPLANIGPQHNGFLYFWKMQASWMQLQLDFLHMQILFLFDLNK